MEGSNVENLDKLFKTPDSSSAAVRATAAALSKRFFDPFGVDPRLEVFVRFVSKFGRRLCLRLAESIIGKLGIDRSLVGLATAENAAGWVTSQYEGLSKGERFNFVVVGAPSGAASHLSSLVNAPFLTQHFLLITRRERGHPDDIRARVRSGIEVAKELNRANGENIEVVIHYDPIHDRLLLKHADTVRFKLKTLPNAYRSFILERLGGEGTILFLDVKYMWKQYRIGDNVTLQIGGLGGISPEEYLYGSDRLSSWLESQESTVRSWNLDDEYPLEDYPESEWGTIGGLEDETREFAEESGFAFLKIGVDHPEKLSERVFNLYVEVLGDQEVGIDRFFFDCFTAINPLFNLLTTTIPVWLPFFCEDSYAFFRRMLKAIARLSAGEEITALITLLPGFPETPDQVPLTRWLDALSPVARNVILVGTSRERYPLDLLYPFNYMKDLVRLSMEMRRPIPSLSSSYMKDLVSRTLL